MSNCKKPLHLNVIKLMRDKAKTASISYQDKQVLHELGGLLLESEWEHVSLEDIAVAVSLLEEIRIALDCDGDTHSFLDSLIKMLNTETDNAEPPKIYGSCGFLSGMHE